MTLFRPLVLTICCSTITLSQAVVVNPPPQLSVSNSSPDFSTVWPTANTSVVTDGSFERHGISVADPSKQPEILAKLLPSTVASGIFFQNISPLLPFTLVIDNKGTLPISAVTVRYEKTTPANTVAEETTFFDTRAHRGREGLLPGSHWIVVPDSRIADDLQRLQSGLQPRTDLTETDVKRILNRFEQRRFSHVAMILDSVVFENGSVLGPDQWGIIAQQQAERSAAQRALKNLSDSSLTDEQLSSWLQEQANEPFLIHPENHPIYDHDKYSEHSLAATVRQTLKTRGRAKATELVSNLILKQNQEKQLTRLEN